RASSPPRVPSFSLPSHALHPHPHSFPTRRSSDLRKPSLKGLTTPRASGISSEGRLIRRRRPSFSKLAPWLTLRGPPTDGSRRVRDRKSTRLNSSHVSISYAVFCLKKKNSTLSHPS